MGTGGTGTPAPGRARVCIGSGWAAYVGPALGLDHHSCAVVCLGLGLDGPLAVEVAGRPTLTARSVLVPAGLGHRVSTTSARVAFLYLEPLGIGHARTAALMNGRDTGGNPVTSGHAMQAALIDSAVAGDVVTLRHLAGGGGGERPPDPRIARVLEALHRPGGADLPTPRLARGCELSPAYFLRLFGETVGVGLRCYRRWARLRTVAEVVAAGGDLTRAAADAGFATPSHLSVAFRRMFGLPPSRLFGAGVDVVVDLQASTVKPSSPAATASTAQESQIG